MGRRRVTTPAQTCHLELTGQQPLVQGLLSASTGQVLCVSFLIAEDTQVPPAGSWRRRTTKGTTPVTGGQERGASRPPLPCLPPPAQAPGGPVRQSKRHLQGRVPLGACAVPQPWLGWAGLGVLLGALGQPGPSELCCTWFRNMEGFDSIFFIHL